MELDQTPSPVRGWTRPALETPGVIDETSTSTERLTSLTSVSHNHMHINPVGVVENGDMSVGTSPALPIHALTCDDGAEEEVLMSDDEDGCRTRTSMAERQSDYFSLTEITTMTGTVSAERAATGTSLPLVPPPQNHGLVGAPAIPEPPARLPHPGPEDSHAQPLLPGSSDTSSTSSPPRPLLPSQPAGSLFERRILPPLRAPQAPPFGRRATIGSDVFSSRLSSFSTIGQDIVGSRQPFDIHGGGYEIPPLTPGILGAIEPADRPRPVSSPGPGARPALGTPHRRRGSSHVPGLSSSNPLGHTRRHRTSLDSAPQRQCRFRTWPIRTPCPSIVADRVRSIDCMRSRRIAHPDQGGPSRLARLSPRAASSMIRYKWVPLPAPVVPARASLRGGWRKS